MKTKILREPKPKTQRGWYPSDRQGPDLHDRLMGFTANMLSLAGTLPEDRAGSFLAEKLLVSATAGYFSHGEAEGSPSAKGFCDKFRDSLSHLRTSRKALRLLEKAGVPCDGQAVRTALEEVDILIRIFFSSVRTLESGLVRN